MPAVVARVQDLRWVVIALGVLLVAGYLGVLYLPNTASWLWAVSLGLSGAAFPLSLSLITARTRDPHVTARLSGFSQTIGYAMAATGPLLVGLMLSATGGWTIPIWVLIATTAAMVAAGLIASAPGYVDDELKP
jgi:CP family cyanate transporter-like MFS transporter